MTARSKPMQKQSDKVTPQEELHLQGKERFSELLKRAVPPVKVPSSE